MPSFVPSSIPLLASLVASVPSQGLLDVDLGPPREVARLAPADLSSADRFGVAVAVAGDTVVVGAPGHDAAGTDAGAAYVFERDAGGEDTWHPVAKLLPPGPGADGLAFGTAVAVSGDFLAVGAPFADSAPGEGDGAVHVYERIAGAWTRVATVFGEQRSELGHAVALDGERLVAGGFGCDFLNCWPFERIVVHERDAGGPAAWGRTALLASPTTSIYCDGYGRSVDVAGERMAVGTNVFSLYCNLDRAYVYERDAGAWGSAAGLDPPPGVGGFGRGFGFPVALGGELLAVGGDSEGSPYVRIVTVFQRAPASPGGWESIAAVPAGDYPPGGENLALQGRLLVAGDPLEDEPGAVAFFLRDLGGPDAFGRALRFGASDGVPDDAFGHALALDGATLAVGAPQALGSLASPGAVYVYGLARPLAEASSMRSSR